MAERPVPGPPTIGVEGEIALLRDLLAANVERLVVARRIEAERKIVFPETTVIIRDIERLLGKVRAKEEAPSPAAPRAPRSARDGSDLERLLEQVGDV